MCGRGGVEGEVSGNGVGERGEMRDEGSMGKRGGRAKRGVGV